MMSQSIVNKVITGLLFLFLFTSSAMCAEGFTVNVLDPEELIILSVDPDTELQLDIDDEYRLQIFLNLTANTTWYVNGEVVKTQLGLDDPYLWFEASNTDMINVTAISTNIVIPFDSVNYTWWINVDHTCYVIGYSPVLPTLPLEEEEEEDEEEESVIIADFIDVVTPPYTGIFDSSLIYAIEDGFDFIAKFMTQMMTFVFTGNNWFSLLFGFVGVIIAGMLSKKENIVVDIILIGSASIILILILNTLFSFLNNNFVINSVVFAILSGSIAMILFNMKEIEDITHMLDA